MDADDQLAMDLFCKAEHVGWDLVTALRPVRLSPWRAEMLLLRVEWLARYRENQRQPQPVSVSQETENDG